MRAPTTPQSTRTYPTSSRPPIGGAASAVQLELLPPAGRWPVGDERLTAAVIGRNVFAVDHGLQAHRVVRVANELKPLPRAHRDGPRDQRRVARILRGHVLAVGVRPQR